MAESLTEFEYRKGKRLPLTACVAELSWCLAQAARFRIRLFTISDHSKNMKAFGSGTECHTPIGYIDVFATESI